MDEKIYNFCGYFCDSLTNRWEIAKVVQSSELVINASLTSPELGTRSMSLDQDVGAVCHTMGIGKDKPAIESTKLKGER